MKLWIFGDSYADVDFDRAGIGDRMWVKQLENHFDVQNYARRGTGPDWSLNILLGLLPVTEPTNLLWIGTSISRPNLNCIEPEEQVSAISWINDHSEYEFLFNQLMATPDWCNTEEHKQFSAINSITHQFNKVLYMPVHPINTEMVNNIDIADNLHLLDDNLINISISEPEYAQVDGPDYRSNHFSQYNHNLLLEKTLDILN